VRHGRLSPVVGSAKKYGGNGPIIRSWPFVTEIVTGEIVSPPAGGLPCSTETLTASGLPPAFLMCRNVVASG
jgi:hypothetical protein